MTISSQEKHNFSLCSCFHAHPTTLLLKILKGPMHGGPPGLPPPQILGGPSPHLKFWGDRPPSPPRSPPLLQLVGRRHLRSSYRGIAAFLSLMSTVTFSTVKPLRRAFSFVAFYIWNALPLEIRLLPKGNTLLLYELLNSVMYYHDWDGNASE